MTTDEQMPDEIWVKNGLDNHYWASNPLKTVTSIKYTRADLANKPALEPQMVNVPYDDGTPSREWAVEPARDAEVREFKFTSYKAAREWLDFPLGNHDTAYWLDQHIEPIKHALDMAIIRAASAVQEPVEVTVEFLHEQYDDDELENADEFLKLLARDYPNGLRILI